MDLQNFVRHLENRSFPLSWPGHFINNQWHLVQKSQTQKISINPSTGETLVQVLVDKNVVDLAIDAAFNAKKSIAAIPFDDRLEILRRIRQTLTDYQKSLQLTLQIEAGKPHWEACEDLDSAVKYLDWISENGHSIFDSLLAPARLGRNEGEFTLLPVGVAAAYLPFSTPITSFVLYVSASVLSGCPLILSSSAHAIVSCMLYSYLTEHLDLPPGLINIIFGNFNSFKQLLADKRIAAVLYTGSHEHCDMIRRESKNQNGRQIVLQSGGKNAVVVDSSADLDHAVKCVVYGALKTAGQRCTSSSRVFVHKSVRDKFLEQLFEVLKNIRVGRTDLNKEHPAPFMGPLYSQKSVEKFLRFQTMAHREAEKTLLWGKTLEGVHQGYFVTPGLHYLSKFDNASAYQGNVLFSPDIAVYDYANFDDAIDMINTTDAAFAVSFIGDPEIIKERRHLFLAPNLLVNMPTVETEATLPLAGRLQSGHHRYHGPGIALYLCYPQVLDKREKVPEFLRSWPERFF